MTANSQSSQRYFLLLKAQHANIASFYYLE